MHVQANWTASGINISNFVCCFAHKLVSTKSQDIHCTHLYSNLTPGFSLQAHGVYNIHSFQHCIPWVSMERIIIHTTIVTMYLKYDLRSLDLAQNFWSCSRCPEHASIESLQENPVYDSSSLTFFIHNCWSAIPRGRSLSHFPMRGLVPRRCGLYGNQTRSAIVYQPRLFARLPPTHRTKWLAMNLLLSS